ncbi:group III truncated hemoglobin [Rapidithrix thailandica]|uniref:Group III truncated hemoglobin n=1 Tax=Rapidithrix thailandica TaxID=413964 RepID=A0AAW9RTR5_9BACT
MQCTKPIEQLEDIRQLVKEFYARVRQDAMLGPVFNEQISDWTKHLSIMYRFWQTLLLEEYTYKGSPFLQHMHLPVTRKHYDHWLDLFCQTVDALFHGAKAEEAKWRASRMAEVFWSKTEFMRETS